ncbi:MAG: hypothetical protein P4L55_04810 [Syntrophobacteraceae bacterium]|nr:hypothetical protein [Syntrophobacteraceae bacterium]
MNNGVLNVSVPQVILDQPRIRALVGQSITARVAQHVRLGRQGKAGQFAIP